MPADDRIELVLLRQFRQVAAKGAQGRRLDIFLGGGLAAAFLLGFRRGEIGIEFLQDFVAGPLDIHFETLQHARRDAFTFAQEPEQNVLGADVGMIERLRFLAGERENFFHARRVRNVADHLGLRPGADLLLDFHPHGFEVETHLLQDVDGHALPELDQAEQQMLGPDVIVVEAVGFLAGERQDLLGSRREIIHCFAARESIRSPTLVPLY